MTKGMEKHLMVQNCVNKLFFDFPADERFTFERMCKMLETRLEAEGIMNELFYAQEMLKGTLCRMVLSDSVKQDGEEYYIPSV